MKIILNFILIGNEDEVMNLFDNNMLKKVFIIDENDNLMVIRIMPDGFHFNGDKYKAKYIAEIPKLNL